MTIPKTITAYTARLKRTHRSIKRIAAAFTITMTVISVVLGGFSLLMAHVPEYRTQMQVWISEHAKLDIQFSALHARWHRFGPELNFADAVVRSRDGKRVLIVAKSGSLGFDVWTALRTGRLTAAQIALQGTELKAIRKANGVFEIVGQADLPEYDHAESFDLNSLPVGAITVSDVRLTFRDYKTKRGPWVVDNIEFTIFRDNDSFDLDGQASLPGALGKQLSFSATGKGSLDDMTQLQWHAKVAGTRLNLKGWTQVMPDDWIAPREGVGSFDVAADFVGAHPLSFAGKFNFADVVMRLPAWKIPLPTAETLKMKEDDGDTKSLAHEPAHESAHEPAASAPAIASSVGATPLRYSKVGLEFNTVLTADGWQTQFNNLQLARDDVAWQPSRASLLLKLATIRTKPVGSTDTTNATEESLSERRVVESVHANAQLVVLDNVWPLLAYLPESEATARLRALNATGRIEMLDVRYERDLNSNEAIASATTTATSANPASDDSADEPYVTLGEPRYALRADFKQLGFAPVERAVGINGVSGTLIASGARGNLHLDSSDVEVTLPRLFRTPLPADHVNGNINWTRTTAGTQLISNDLAIQSPNGSVQTHFTLDMPRQGSPLIDMQATATNLEAASAPRYMPAGVMTRRTLSWLDAAFTAGHVTQAQLTLKGPLQKFPFRHDPAQAAGDEDGLFLITAEIDGLTLNYQTGWTPATGLHVQTEFRNNGFTATTTAGEVNGLTLDNVSGGIADFHDAVLRFKAQTHGDLDNALRYSQQSPIGPVIGSLFQQLNGHGDFQAQTTMLLPLKDLAKRQVDIDVHLQNATLGLNDVKQQASQVQGHLHIANDAVTVANLTARFLQGSLSTVTTTATDPNHSNVVVTGHALAAPLADFLSLPAFVKISGDLNYRFTTPGYAQHDVEGHRNLFTVDSDLQGLKLDLPAPVAKEAAVIRPIHVDADLHDTDVMQLRASLGDLRSLIRLQHATDGWHFERGGLRVDAVPAALPANTGLRIEGTLPEFTLDDWLKLGNGKPNTPNNAATHVQDVLRAANVNIGRFHLYGFEWPEVRAVLQATDIGWSIDVAGPQAVGRVAVPYTFDPNQPLTVEMDKLVLTPHDTATVAANSDATASFDPRELPSLQVNVKDFHFDEHDFGTLQASATRTAQGLQVDGIQVSSDSFNGAGTGSWLQTDTGVQTALMFTMDSNDVRKTLRQLNYADYIAAKQGKLQANLSWVGGLDANIMGRLSGTLELQLDDGQLLTLQPGAGRVLGLLSVAALPRRLHLDFHDVTDKGLAFDSIHGNFDLKVGNAMTSNLLLRGPTAEIGVAGRIGLGVHDYDQTAVVTGDVGSALPVAGAALAASPIVGAALLVFSEIFKEPLKGVARAYYHIGGSWDDPQVERVDAHVGRASMLNSASATSASGSSQSSSSQSSASQSTSTKSRVATH